MALFNLNVDGRTRVVDVDPATPLLYVLTDDLALRGPKFGCGLGQWRRVHGHSRWSGDPVVYHARGTGCRRGHGLS